MRVRLLCEEQAIPSPEGQRGPGPGGAMTANCKSCWDARLRHPDADEVPGDHCPRGSAHPGRRLGGVLAVRRVRPRVRALAGIGDRVSHRVVARACGTRCRSTSPCPPSGPSAPTRSSPPPAAGQPRSRWPSAGRAGGGRRARHRRPRRARRGGPAAGSGSTRTAAGAWTRRRACSALWRSTAWSTPSSPARPSTSWRRFADLSTSRSPPTSRSARPRTRCGSGPPGPPTS